MRGLAKRPNRVIGEPPTSSEMQVRIPTGVDVQSGYVEELKLPWQSHRCDGPLNPWEATIGPRPCSRHKIQQ